MPLKPIMDKSLAVLYAVFSLLMLCSALASLTQNSTAGILICIFLAAWSAYMAFRRWKGSSAIPGKESTDQ